MPARAKLSKFVQNIVNFLQFMIGFRGERLDCLSIFFNQIRRNGWMTSFYFEVKCRLNLFFNL
jgi:hypothetical protein